NILGSVSQPTGTTPRLLSHLLMSTIPAIQHTKTIASGSINGISYTAAVVVRANPIPARNERSTSKGRNFNSMDITKPPMVAKSAALDVVFFQKNPNRNIANIHGDTKPVYSWIY